MIADKDRLPQLELSVEDVAALSNALRELSYLAPLRERQRELMRRLAGWLRENGATRDMNGWWRVKEVVR